MTSRSDLEVRQMDKTQNRNIGRLGEQIAVELLKKKGYQILETNWGNKWGEVDVICEDNDVFVFVEVKTKVGQDFGSPEEMVGRRKLMQVQRIAGTYFPAVNFPRRIDVVAVVLDHDLKPIRTSHYEAVY